MDAAERARLVEQHLDMSRRAAATIFPRVKKHIEFEELVAFGNEGLAEAAQRVDPDSGAAFTTYAWYRVQGAIIDGLRRATNMPRRTWAKLVALRAANEYLETQSEREVGARARGAPPAAGTEALSQIKNALSAIRTI